MTPEGLRFAIHKAADALIVDDCRHAGEKVRAQGRGKKHDCLPCLETALMVWYHNGRNAGPCEDADVIDLGAENVPPCTTP